MNIFRFWAAIGGLSGRNCGYSARGRLTARGNLTHRSGRLFFAEAVLEDGDGRQLARGSGTFLRSQIRLAPEIGYR